jgi:hypothetical protein
MRRILGVLAIIGMISVGAIATGPTAGASTQSAPIATPSTVAPGAAFTVSGVKDCMGGTTLTVAIAGLGLSQTVTGAFDWSLDFTAPADAAPNTYPITIDGSECSYPDGTLTIAIPQSISLVKTVGTVAGVCATTTAITVAAGTTVYYCYTVTNNTGQKLGVHDLTDDKMGAILTLAAYDLIPGASVNTVTLGKTVSTSINATTKNTATWTAHTEPGIPFSATASATVTVSAKPAPPAVAAQTAATFTG